jgi:hypothetical protein
MWGPTLRLVKMEGEEGDENHLAIVIGNDTATLYADEEDDDGDGDGTGGEGD